MPALCFHDLDFDRIPVEFRSSRNAPYVRRLRIGMPRIPQTVLRSVFYLYENKEDAEAGRGPGGTGFIVRVWPHHYYAVTNWHVAVDHEHPVHPVIRLNTKDGGTDVLDLGPEDWDFIPGKNDIAVYPLTLSANHEFSYVPADMFVKEPPANRPPWQDPAIGVGEDAFMIGLFVDHAGVTTNVPSARFGNVSMLSNPNAPIEQLNGYFGESYVVDMHSRSGFSGSPVFVYRTFGADLTTDGKQTIRDLTVHANRLRTSTPGIFRADATFKSDNMFKLLGIHWGQFPEEWEIGNGVDALPEVRRKQLITNGEYVKGLSGMTCVIPAWKIQEVLDMPKFKKPRDAAALQLQQRMRSKPVAESTGASAPPASDANPTHREDFNRLLGAAVQKPAQED